MDTIKKKFGSVLKKNWRRKNSSSEKSFEESDKSKNEYDFDDSFLVEGEEDSIQDDSGEEESGTATDEDSTSE